MVLAWHNFKDLHRRTPSDKVLRNKAFNIAKNQSCDGYQRGITRMIFNFFFFHKRPFGGAVTHAGSKTLAMWDKS